MLEDLMESDTLQVLFIELLFSSKLRFKTFLFAQGAIFKFLSILHQFFSFVFSQALKLISNVRYGASEMRCHVMPTLGSNSNCHTGLGKTLESDLN